MPDTTGKSQRQWGSFKRYIQRLAKCKNFQCLDGWSKDRLIGYWTQKIANGHASAPYVVGRLLVLHERRAHRGLQPTGVSGLEEYIKP